MLVPEVRLKVTKSQNDDRNTPGIPELSDGVSTLPYHMAGNIAAGEEFSSD